MKKIITLLLLLLLTRWAQGQQIVNAEYFFDDDPGIGNGIPFIIGSADDSVDVAPVIDASSLPLGFHYLCFRFQDTAGVWSFAESRLIYIHDTISPAALPVSPALITAEYFIDDDPGQGNGISFTFASDDSVTTNPLPNASSYPPGFHYLGMRFKDADGIWGLSESRLFYIYDTAAPPQQPVAPPLVAGEYFFDNDPGVGKGTSFSIGAPADSIDILDSVSVLGINVGPHKVCFRFKDQNGNWSLCEDRSFTVCATTGATAGFDYYVYGNDVIFSNTSQNLASSTWAISDGYTTTQNDFVHYFDSAGVYSVKLVTNAACSTKGDSITKTVFIKGIRSITPAKGGNIAAVTMTITGAGFLDGTNVRLVKAGESDLVPMDSSTIITDERNIQTIFNLNGAKLGLWDVIVTVPNDSTYKIIKGFEIDSPKFPEPYVQLVGPDRMRRHNIWHDYSLIVGNKGNIDAVGVPVWFALPPHVNVNLKFQVNYPKDTTVLFWDTVPKYFITDTLFDKITKVKVYGFLVDKIPPGSEVILNFQLQTLESFQIIYWTSRPFILNDSIQIKKGNPSCFIDPDKLDCFIDIASDLIPAPQAQCIANYVGYSLKVLNATTCEYNRDEEVSNSVVWGFVDATLSCLGGFTPEKYMRAFEIMQRLFNILLSGGTSTGDACSDALYDDALRNANVTSITSFDPNEKSGSTGAENSPFLQGSDNFNYVVAFENVDTATAAAQTVIIIDTLDKANLDLNTFQLNQIAFSDTIITVTQGRKSYTTDIDLRPRIPLIVRMAAFLNESTGVATWTFNSLDTLTMEPTTDVILGFLPPNDSSGVGQGSVSYSIKTMDGIPTGTVINNKADIYFDFNDPITTQTWINVIDNLKPQSNVDALPLVTASDSINVSWSGSDNGPAGVYAYNVYYNINGGGWVLWKYNTLLTNDVFVGVRDSTYGFYTVAIDSALNIEDAPSGADAITTISTVTGIREDYQSHLWASVYPNPGTGTFNVTAYSDIETNAVLKVCDILGNVVSQTTPLLNKGLNHFQLDLTDAANGVYFLTLANGKGKVLYKLIKQ